MHSYTWDLENVFSDFDSLQKDFSLIENMINIFGERDFFSSMNKEDFISFFSDCELIERKIKKIYTFCSLHNDIDFNDVKYAEMKTRINKLYISFNNNNELYKKRLSSFGYKRVVKFIRDNNLNYDFQIEKIINCKKENLNRIKKEQFYKENINNARNEYRKITSQLIFEPLFVNNKEKSLTESNYSAHLNDRDRGVRKQVFTKYFNAIYKNKDNFYNAFEKYVISYSELTKISKYTSSLKKYCANNNFSYDLYNNVINIISDNVSILTDFFDVKKEVLGIDNFEYYDIFAPMDCSNNYSYDEAVILISHSLSILGDEYLKIMKKVFQENWIDVYPRPNKKSGYYSVNCYDLKPYIFINFEGKYKDMTILSHEIGHSIHTYFSNNNQSYSLSSTQNNLEIPSLVNELLLGNYLITNGNNKSERLLYINNLLIVYFTCFYRYGMLAEFEKNIYDYVDENDCINFDDISEYYYILNRKYLGNLINDDSLLKYEWLNISHFYREFYCYKYVVGIACATKIVDNLLKGDELYRKRYIKFLKSGCSGCINDLLKEMDIDINDSSLYLETINKINLLILEFKKNSSKQ